MHPHWDTPFHALHDPDQIHVLAVGARSWWHEVDDSHRPLVGCECRLQHQRLPPVATIHGGRRIGGSEKPVTSLRAAQKRGETRPRVEPGQAEPVDGSIAAHQGSSLGVPDEPVILDGMCDMSLR